MSLDPASASPPPFPLPAVAPPEFVTSDVPCRKCSYNLRTQPIAGKCPECGAPVGVSIYGDLLRYSEPRWLHMLATGTKLILINIAIVIGMVIVGMIFGGMGVANAVWAKSTIQLIALAGNILGFFGSWLLTERDPGGIGEDQYGTARKVIRVTLLCNVAGGFISFVFNLTTLSPAGSGLLAAASGLLGIIGVIGVYALLQYLEKLARRIPDDSLSARAKMLKVWLCTIYGIFLVIGIIAGVAMMVRGAAGPNLGVMMVIGCFALVLGIVLLVLGIMYILMIDRFRTAFNQQAALAEQIWGIHGDPAQ
jgi:hypothetical protein